MTDPMPMPVIAPTPNGNGIFPAEDLAGQTVAAIAQAETVSAGE